MCLKINGQHVNKIIFSYILLSATISILPFKGTVHLYALTFFHSIVILYLRFGAQVLQDNFVAELSTHYQNYILVL